jgi:hypothetical protein
MAKIYIAARAKTQLEEVKQIQKKLRSLGHEIAYDWAIADINIKKPYRDSSNRLHNLAATEKMLKTAAKTDVFILLDEPGLRGAYVELGAFLTDCLSNPEGRKAYIVGPDAHEREFIFESPEYVKFADTIEEVYKDLNK